MMSSFILAGIYLIGVYCIVDHMMDRQEKLSWDIVKYQQDPDKIEKMMVVEAAEKIIRGR